MPARPPHRRPCRRGPPGLLRRAIRDDRAREAGGRRARRESLHALAEHDVEIGHEAKIGKISDDVIFYLMSRGISENDAKALIVRGFVEPISKELPLEYAVEIPGEDATKS